MNSLPLPRLGRYYALAANAPVLVLLVYAWAIQKWSADFYYRSLQEDEYLEWATFWAFVLAGAIGFVAARRQRRASGRLPWFLAGVGLFCLVVAMEEISWGQRLLGYRPPTYFLAHNFQQELNVHNVFATGLRKLALKGVILGYGVALPVLAWWRGPGRRLAEWGIVAPPLALAPAFLATYLLYEAYPWQFTGEVVELMLGAAFLLGLLAAVRPADGETTREARRGPLVAMIAAWALALGLGVATAAASNLQRRAHPGNLQAAASEAEALARDFIARAEGRGDATRCGLHKRVYSFVEKYEATELRRGGFAGLVARGLPEERAAYFIDPWNSPYWIRHQCSKDRSRQTVFVYSFGPNRRRDSSAWKVRGDDVGAVVRDPSAG